MINPLHPVAVPIPAHQAGIPQSRKCVKIFWLFHIYFLWKFSKMDSQTFHSLCSNFATASCIHTQIALKMFCFTTYIIHNQKFFDSWPNSNHSSFCQIWAWSCCCEQQRTGNCEWYSQSCWTSDGLNAQWVCSWSSSNRDPKWRRRCTKFVIDSSTWTTCVHHWSQRVWKVVIVQNLVRTVACL